MAICDNCIHDEVCGLEGHLDEALTFCANKAADVQPLSVVAEHIKKRLYQTAFNTTEVEARDTIVDMAKRIDLWIDELKDGETE